LLDPLRPEPLACEPPDRDDTDAERVLLPERSPPPAFFFGALLSRSVYWFFPDGLWLLAMANPLLDYVERDARKVSERTGRNDVEAAMRQLNNSGANSLLTWRGSSKCCSPVADGNHLR